MSIVQVVREKDRQIVLLGYSGHAFVVVEAALMIGMKIKGYAAKAVVGINPYKIDYLGDEKSPEFTEWNFGTQFLLGIGDNIIRTKVARFIQAKGYECITLIHPDSSVSNFTEIDTGTFVARNAAVNPLCKIGKDVIINTSASLDHECIIGNGSHIAPGAILAGNVTVGKKSFIGANAVIKQGVTIGNNVVIGAGTVVLKDIKSGKRIVGNPARVINE